MASLGDGEARVNVAKYGALVSCGGRAAVASGSAVPGEIYVEQLTGGVITSLAHRVLAGGESYDLASAPAEGSAGGLSNITAVAGLESAADPALLVGSSDGYLYALDACDLTLRWSLDLHFPVGDPIVADADGDGQDDVFVSVADGFLYGITGAAYMAPEPVLDLYPGMPGGTDVDEVDSPASLAARWAAVTGATSYELAVLTPGGTALTSPAFHDVGAVTQTILHDLPLRLDGRYVIAVRALGPSGASGEATSDGVVVRDLLAPDANFSGPDAVYFSDGVPGNFVLNARDNWSLGAYRVEVRDGADALIYSLGSGDFSGTSGAASLAWGGETDSGSVAPLGSYRLVAHVSDASGHEAMVEWPVELAESRPDMADGGRPDGGGVDSGVGGGGSGGCGCVIVGAERRQPWLLLPLLGLLVWRLRRRRGR